MHTVRMKNVHKLCVQLLYTYNLNSEENEVGPDSGRGCSSKLASGVSRVHQVCPE